MKKFVTMFVVSVIALLTMFVSAAILGIGKDSPTYIPVALALGVTALSAPYWTRFFK